MNGFYEGFLKVQKMIVKITQLFPWLGKYPFGFCGRQQDNDVYVIRIEFFIENILNPNLEF